MAWARRDERQITGAPMVLSTVTTTVVKQNWGANGLFLADPATLADALMKPAARCHSRGISPSGNYQNQLLIDA
jgi:hypothetical protein